MKIKLALLGFLLLPLAAAGQATQQDSNTQRSVTLIFRGTPIEEAIQMLVEETKMDLIYDPSILNAQKVFSISREEDPETILSNILKGTKLDFIRLSSGTYVIIEAAKSESRYGSLAGMVLDKSTGKPLEGANVLLADASTGTSTNRSGRFTIAPLISGNYEVTITYVGYKPVRDTISIPNQGDGARRFYLESRPVFVEPVVVSSIQRRLPHVSSEGEQVNYLTEILGGYTGSPDAIRSINSVMGLNFSIPMADFNVQGGAEGEHQVLLDGVPVYNPVSFGRLTGAFSPFALRKITIHKAGYPASVGSQLSGVVAIDQDIPSESENSATIQGDPLNVNARLNTAVNLGDAEIKTMVAARSNIWNWYEKPSLSNTLENWDRLDPIIASNLLNSTSQSTQFRPVNHGADVNFYDLHLANQIDYNDFHTTSLSLYRGKNYLQTQLLAHNSANSQDVPEFMYTQDTYDWQNTAARVEYQWLMSSRLNASFAFSYSKHHSNHHFGMSSSDVLLAVPSEQDRLIGRLQDQIANQEHTGDDNMVRETAFKADFEYSLHQHHNLRFGIEPKFVNYSFRLSDLFYHFSTSKSRTFMLAGYLQDSFSLSYNTKLTGGSRFTYIPKQEQFYLEPRLSLQVDYPETSLGFLSLKFSTGIYRQFINQFDITNVGPSTIVPSIRFWVPVDFTTDVPKSYHFSTEALVEPTENLTFRWEGFYKWNPTILAIDYHALLEEPVGPVLSFDNQSRFISHGKSYSLGTGISAETLIEPLMMDLSLSYQYSLAERKLPKRFEGQFITTPWNEPHKLTAAVNWKVTSSVTTTLRWQSIWGRAWAYNRAYYDYLTIDQNQNQFGTINFQTPSDDKLNPYHQLDAAISYTQSVGSGSLQLKANLINLLDRKNLLEKRLLPNISPEGSTEYAIERKSLPGFIPSVSLQFSY